MANKRPPWKIPDVINPPNRRCIQIEVPDDPQHIAILWGVLRSLSDWQRWEREPLKLGTQVAQVWRDVVYSIDWSNMSCCPQPTNRRYNEDGVLEVSFDGGITWVAAPDADDRMSGIVAPNLPGADDATKRCIGATSAQAYVEANLIDDLTTGMTYAEINAALVAIVAILGITGVGLLLAAAAAAIFIAGVAAVQAAFTSEVWADFRCILYCNMNDNASFTEVQWERVKAAILDTFTGVVSAILYNWVNSVGPVGLTNAARSGFASSGDCSSCEPCADCAYKITFDGLNFTDFTVTYGSVSSNRLNLVTHTYDLGEGTGAKIVMDLGAPCDIMHIAADILFVNQRPDNYADIIFYYQDTDHTPITNNGLGGAGVADGVQRHVEHDVDVLAVRYIEIEVSWLNNFGDPNNGWIDSISINYG